MPDRTDLLVIGAGPYAYSAAALARDNGIDTHVVGHPMAFWRQQMPADMFLRSGPDWHLDARGEHTFAAFFEDRGSAARGRRPDPDRASSSTTPSGSASASRSTSTSAWSPT